MSAHRADIKTNPHGVDASQVLARLHPDHQPVTETLPVVRQRNLPAVPESQPEPVPQRHYWWTDLLITGLLAAGSVVEYLGFRHVSYWLTWGAVRLFPLFCVGAFLSLAVCYVIERVKEPK
jgi:hypothetical protein